MSLRFCKGAYLNLSYKLEPSLLADRPKVGFLFTLAGNIMEDVDMWKEWDLCVGCILTAAAIVWAIWMLASWILGDWMF